MVRHRTTIFVELDAHANLISILETFVFVFVDQIRFQELESEPIAVAFVIDHANQAFTITRQGFDDHRLGVRPGILSIDRAVAGHSPTFPFLLDDPVSDLIERSVRVLRFHLERASALANHVGLQQMHIPLRVFVIAYQFPATIPERLQRVPELRVSGTL